MDTPLDPTPILPWTTHARRLAVLSVATALVLGWMTDHCAVTYGDGLRYIRQAESYARTPWSQVVPKAIDHPVHPLLIAGAHALIGGDTPASWQRAAQVVAVAAGTLLVVPVYLATALLIGATWAWVGPVLAVTCPLVHQTAPNVLSESTFLVFWFAGLAAAFQFLKQGALGWLIPVVGFSALAYLTRPEGLLLPVALVLTVLVSPVSRGTRLDWRRWSLAMAVMVVGPALLLGPFVVAKGGLATKPAVGRVLGLSSGAAALALEREKDVDPDLSPAQQYQQAVVRVGSVLMKTATPAILLFGVWGLVALLRARPETARLGVLSVAIVLGIGFALVRLYVKAGYATGRHFVVAITVISLFAAYGAIALAEGCERWAQRWKSTAWLRGRAPTLAVLTILALAASTGWRTFAAAGPGFSPYHQAGAWLAAHAEEPGAVLDLTNWSLYFSERTGYQFGDLYDASRNPQTRWILAQAGHLQGKFPYTRAVRALVGGREPVAVFPASGQDGGSQIAIYDRNEPERRVMAGASPNVRR
jgi:hypothetical protein